MSTATRKGSTDKNATNNKINKMNANYKSNPMTTRAYHRVDERASAVRRRHVGGDDNVTLRTVERVRLRMNLAESLR
jgi:hypothetical protein